MSDTVNKYLTFTLDEEFFALDISTVREIQDVTTITRIPQASPHMRGVVNLRGNAVPVLDIKLQFGMARTEQTIHTRIIILECVRNGKEVHVGVLADSVKEVLEIEDKDIDPPPRMGTVVQADCIKGVAKKNNRFILLLDMHRVLGLQAERDEAEAHGNHAEHETAETAEA